MQVVKKLLKKKLRGPTKVVLTESLPQVLQHDGIQKPDELCFKVDMYPSEMLKTAQHFIKHADTKVYATYAHGGRVAQVFFLNTYTSMLKLTRNLRKQYLSCLNGTEPTCMDIESLIPEEGSDVEKSFQYTAAVCASIHLVFVLPPDSTDQACLPCELNPSGLLCTCKTFRGGSLCPHVIAATALFMPETYTAEYLDELLEIISSKRGVKRPQGPRRHPDPARLERRRA